KTKNLSVGVLLDGYAVVHLVDAQDLRLSTVATKFVILAHDERLDRLGRVDLGAEPAKPASREVGGEVVQHLDLEARLAMAAERNQIIGAGLRALIADDAGLRAGGRLGLQSQHAAKAGRRGSTLGWILEGERRPRRVFRGDPQSLDQV